MGLSKDQAKPRLRALLTELAAIWATPEGKSLGEAMTRHNFINKYIDLLGYESIADLELEHPVRNTGKFIDYVLKVGGDPAIAVEAKPLGLSLSDDVGAQLLEYQVVENIEWGVATNARQVWVYYLYVQGPARDKCVLKMDLLSEDLDARFDILFERFWLLSKESMATGIGLRSLVKDFQLEKAIEGAILDKTSRVVQALRADVRDHTGGKIKVTPDEVASWLRNRLVRVSVPPSPGRGPEPPPPAEKRPFPTYLKQMIEREIIPAGAQVSAEYGGQEHTAVIDAEGWLSYKGERIRKPGSAAKRITGEPTDGFEFWKYQGVPLARLRDKLWQK
jgi:hypothetical protein